jgi:hypothetical protein
MRVARGHIKNQPPILGWLLIVVEKFGHADLLRERIDRITGV